MRIAVIQPDRWDVSSRGHAAFHHLIERAHREGADAVITPDGLVGCLDGSVRLEGEESFDLDRIAELGAESLVLAPAAGSPLEAEAVIEYAVALSGSAAGLVIVVEPSTVGGSAIVLLGEVLAEADEGEALIAADVTVPTPQPRPRAPLPELPPIIVQRMATRCGFKPDPGYPADLD